jgi:4-amino-4-deoxy-L-arabinose transferase-like glycosyltransferase
LVVTALAALSYSWDTGSTIEIYYAAAVRSMSQSWHNFVFGAFDPAGTVTVDKLPGALWVQALSVRIFGFHEWAILAPQAVEGALTVLVLYHCVVRLAGPVAAVASAVVLAASPATVALNRGNVPDTLMILLLVLAADATVSAIVQGRWRSAVLAGVWVALAFQAKMLEAWLILPALGVAYLVAGRPDSLPARLARGGVALATTAVLSLAYMTFVTLTPESSRPYVDGSTTDSVFHQVFVYNGFNRVGQASPNAQLGHTLGTPLFSQFEPAPVWNRLLTGAYGHDTGWLLPAALVALAFVLVARGRTPRRDLPRAGAVLWGLWLVVLAVVFTTSTTMNSYYAGALSPAVAALLGIGGALAWERRDSVAVLLGVAAVVLVTAGYAAWLLPDSGTGLPSWLEPLVLALGVAAAAGIGVAAAAAHRRSPAEGGEDGDPAPGSRRRPIVLFGAACLAGGALLLVPVVASASVVAQSLGPFDTPFQPVFVTTGTHTIFAPTSSPPALASILSVRRGAPWLMAAQTSAVAAPYIYATGEEVLPLGGFTGVIPTPTAAEMRSYVDADKFHLALVASPAASPSAVFVAGSCLHVQAKSQPGPVPKLKIYYCLASHAAPTP